MHTPDEPIRALKRRSHAPVRNTASPPQQPPPTQHRVERAALDQRDRPGGLSVPVVVVTNPRFATSTSTVRSHAMSTLKPTYDGPARALDGDEVAHDRSR